MRKELKRGSSAASTSPLKTACESTRVEDPSRRMQPGSTTVSDFTMGNRNVTTGADVEIPQGHQATTEEGDELTDLDRISPPPRDRWRKGPTSIHPAPPGRGSPSQGAGVDRSSTKELRKKQVATSPVDPATPEQTPPQRTSPQQRRPSCNPAAALLRPSCDPPASPCDPVATLSRPYY